MVTFTTRLTLANRKGLQRYVAANGLKVEHVINMLVRELLDQKSAGANIARRKKHAGDHLPHV